MVSIDKPVVQGTRIRDSGTAVAAVIDGTDLDRIQSNISKRVKP